MLQEETMAQQNIIATPAEPDEPTVCKTYYVVMECTCSAIFAWMLIEGIYLRYFICKEIMKSFEFKMYCWFAWGVTIFLTTVWAFTTKPNHVDETSVKVIMLLTPVLGFINILNMIDISIYSSNWKVALWLYVSHFLRSLQVYFLSLFYSLFHGEVRKTLKRKIQALRFWKFFSWKRPVNKKPQVVNQVLSDEFMNSVPPPPFFRIDSAGNPTTRLECGCKPRIDVHHRCCSLDGECVLEMTDCCGPLCDDSVPIPSRCMQQHSARIAVYPEIHAAPQRRQRSEPIEVIEMIETTV